MLAIATTAYDPAEWTDLFVATAGASAALAGLVFVAVSINIERILALEGLPDRALSTTLLLLAVMLVSIFGLVPGQSRQALGGELLGLSLLTVGAVGALTFKSRPSGDRVSWLVSRGVTACVGPIAFVVCGASLLTEAGGASIGSSPASSSHSSSRSSTPGWCWSKSCADAR